MRFGATGSNMPNGGGGAWAGPRSPMAANGGTNPNTGTTTPVVVTPAVVVSAPASTVNKTLLYAGLGLLAWMMLKHKKI